MVVHELCHREEVRIGSIKFLLPPFPFSKYSIWKSKELETCASLLWASTNLADKWSPETKGRRNHYEPNLSKASVLHFSLVCLWLLRFFWKLLVIVSLSRGIHIERWQPPTAQTGSHQWGIQLCAWLPTPITGWRVLYAPEFGHTSANQMPNA